MRKPNFFIVGAPRCGTRSMYEYLKAHPEITTPIYQKEPHYFGTDFKSRRFDRFRGNEAKYLALFAHGADRKRIGEASVFYLYSKLAAQEIYQYNPEAKIIAMLREPVSMLHSYYYRLLKNQDETIDDFAQALVAEPDRKAGKRIPKTLYLMPEALYYSEIVKFSEQLTRYFDLFGRENTHVIIFDDFKADTPGVYRSTLDFLEVDSSFQPDLTPLNPNSRSRSLLLRRLMRNEALVSVGYRVRRISLPVFVAFKRWNARPVPRELLDPALKSRLQQQFKPEIERLSELLGRDLSAWYQT
jgi:hypothetical protein